MGTTKDFAPALQVSQWFNTPKPIALEDLRGRVAVLHAFQMLCPGCVSHSIPQALRLYQLMPKEEVAVIGLHTEFEHHEEMGAASLKAFLHEYRVPYPVGIDKPVLHGTVPLTMQAYGLRGTPSLVILDQHGRVRLNHFGQVDDLQLGLLIGQLLAEARTPALAVGSAPELEPGAASCADGHCELGAQA